MCAMFLAACGQSESAAQEQAVSAAQVTSVDELLDEIETDAEDGVQTFAAPITNSNPIVCTGVLKQGGLVLCQTFPDALVTIGDQQTLADEKGLVVLGFDRDAPKMETVTVSIHNTGVKTLKLNLAPREYAISRIDGLPPSQVTPRTEAQIKHIQASTARKNKGFSSREQTMWFKDGFTYPLKTFTKTSPFGARRILNGEKKRPHYGVDIAAPVGTPIYAPADGVISLADDDLYFEGAMVLVDHGQGLISMYLHMSAIDVEPGQVVKRGDKLGEVGSRGRSTGPHLCWRLKWRNRHLDPELLTKWPSHEHAND